jgi:hypothetical protein
MKKVVITVPHAICSKEDSDNYYHSCDKVAIAAAKSLAAAFKEKGIESKLFVPTRPRIHGNDMNRKISRESTFRKELRSFIKDNIKDIGYVLDVHSYPESVEYYGTFDAYLLDDTKSKYFSKECTAIERYLISSGYNAKTFVGFGNDIQDESLEIGVPSVLVEFNENLEKQQHRMSSISKIICTALINVNK